MPWEKNMCVCSGCSWGWMADDPVSDFDWLIRMMVNVVCRGGNWLVNIGPDRNGKISGEIRQRMRQVGDWLRTYGESIYATAAGPYEPVDDVYGATWRENKVYLHILDRKAFAGLKLPLSENVIEHAALFDGSPVEVVQEEDGIRLVLPEGSGRAGEMGSGQEMEGSAPDTIVVLTMTEAVKAAGDAEITFTGKG